MEFSESETPEPDQPLGEGPEQNEFERNMSCLISRAREHLMGEDRSRWNNAVTALRSEDHYLLVLIDNAESVVHWARVWKIVAVVAGLFLAIILALNIAGRLMY